MISRRRFLKVAGAGASALALAACTGSNEGQTSEQPAESESAEQVEPVAVRTTALKGPTAMGLVRFMSEVDAGNLADNDYSFQIVASPDEVTPLIAKGEVDIAAVPANLASVLYNKTEKGVRAIAINTLGVLYICELGDTVQSVADLKGKTIYASGKGSASRTSRARPSMPPARGPRPSTASSTSSRRTASRLEPTFRSSGRASTPSASRPSRRPPVRRSPCSRSPS